jgi:alpha-1,2-mannosyltransferase
VPVFGQGSWLNSRRLKVYPGLFLLGYVISAIGWGLKGKHPLGADFAEFWAASHLALAGHPWQVYAPAQLWAVEKAAAGPLEGLTAFPYPPSCLLLIRYLAALSYFWSMALWSAAGLLLYSYTIFRIAGRKALWPALAFPGAFLNLINGQNGFLTLTLLGLAIVCVDESPLAAGALFGLSAYKPQFVTLVPLFLAASRRWKALAAFGASVAIFYGVSYAAFGHQTWSAFLSSLAYTRTVILERGGTGWAKTQSMFGAARMWGLSVTQAYALHGLVAAIAVCAALSTWRRSPSIALQGSVLIAATLLITPHLMPYDLVLLALPIAWLAAEGMHAGFLNWEKNLLALLWAFPAFALTLNGRGASASWLCILLPLVLAARRRCAENGDVDGAGRVLARPTGGTTRARPRCDLRNPATTG